MKKEYDIKWIEENITKVSDDVIRKYANDLNWFTVCRVNSLDEEFIIKYEEYVSMAWHYILYYQYNNISSAMILDIITHENINYKFLKSEFKTKKNLERLKKEGKTKFKLGELKIVINQEEPKLYHYGDLILKG